MRHKRSAAVWRRGDDTSFSSRRRIGLDASPRGGKGDTGDCCCLALLGRFGRPGPGRPAATRPHRCGHCHYLARTPPHWVGNPPRATSMLLTLLAMSWPTPYFDRANPSHFRCAGAQARPSRLAEAGPDWPRLTATGCRLLAGSVHREPAPLRPVHMAPEALMATRRAVSHRVRLGLPAPRR